MLPAQRHVAPSGVEEEMRASVRHRLPRRGPGREARRRFLGLGLALALAGATTAPVSPGSGPAYRDCRCLAQGERFRLGERVCLRGRIAVCERVLNNTSWRVTQEPCPPAA